MTTLTPHERRAKRAAAHNLHPVVAVGQHGLTPAVLHEVDVALAAHELIKVRVFDDDRAAREALMARICAEMQCAPVQHIGKLLVLWRPNPAKESRTPKTRHAPARKAKPSGTDDPRKAKKKPRTRDVRKEKGKASTVDGRSAGPPRARTRDDDRPPRVRGAPNARRRRAAPVVETEPPAALPPRGDQSRRRRRAVKA